MSSDHRAVDARILESGEARVLVPMTVREAEELAFATSSDVVRRRLIQAIGLLDRDTADYVSRETE